MSQRPQVDKNHRRIFRSVPLAALVKPEVQAVPEGAWLELKPQTPCPLKLTVYKLSPNIPKGQENDLQLQFCGQQYLREPLVLQPAQFFVLDFQEDAEDIRGTAEFSTIPHLYFNKKFNEQNGLGPPHSEVAYFKSYYAHLHPKFGLRPLQVLDLGCGRGRNAVIFASNPQQDYQVLGLDQNAQSLAAYNSMAENLTAANQTKNQAANAKLLSQQVDLNIWREAPAHDIAMAIVSLQFLQSQAANDLLCHCMETATRGALHLAVFPIASGHPNIIWPGGFHFLPQSSEVKYLYMQKGWSILEYRESYGHLGKIAADGLPIRGLFATLIAQKT